MRNEIQARLRNNTLVRSLFNHTYRIFSQVIFPRRYGSQAPFDFIQRINPDMVLDIGANVGQFISQCRSKGYRGEVIAIEPLSSTFKHLSKIHGANPRNLLLETAIGSFTGSVEINIATNLGMSSSILKPSINHHQMSPNVKFPTTEKVSLTTLEKLDDDFLHDFKNVFMKIDVQGYELEVLSTLPSIAHKVRGMLIETSFVGLYENGSLFSEVISILAKEDFRVIGVFPKGYNRISGEFSYCDILVERI